MSDCQQILESSQGMVDAFKVWVTRMDGATSLRVAELDDTRWLLDRLSSQFVFKTCEPLRNIANLSAYTFRIAHTSQLSASHFERILVRMPEVKMIIEPLELPNDFRIAPAAAC